MGASSVASRTEEAAVDTPAGSRILIVAHKSVATPSLVDELSARTAAGP